MQEYVTFELEEPIANNQDQKLEIEEIDDDSPNLDINEFMAQNK